MQRLIFFALLLGLLQACNSRQQTAQQQTADTTSTAEAAPKAIPLTDRLTALGLTTDSHWRGINLGDALATVRQNETGKAELFEDKTDHLGYAVDLPSLESMDVLYYQSGGKVSAIEMDLYLNTKKAVTAYMTDLTAYFTGRYGTGKAGTGTTIWTDPAGQPISLKDISAGKDFGIKVRIGSSPAITASTK